MLSLNSMFNVDSIKSDRGLEKVSLCFKEWALFLTVVLELLANINKILKKCQSHLLKIQSSNYIKITKKLTDYKQI